MSLSGMPLFITGASGGIGLRAARDGANVVIAAKTAEPHPKLPGTIYTAATEVEAAGGHALPHIVDVRYEASVQAAVDAAVSRFGGIDICVNNARAISLTRTLQTDMKRYDLMNQINLRSTFVVSRACIPHLLKSANPHILTLSPLSLNPECLGDHVAYTLAKFGMSACVLGMAREFASAGLAFNCLWPITTIATSAVRNLSGETAAASRTPEIMAEAAYRMLNKPSRSFTAQFVLDELFLRAEGVTEFGHYAVAPGTPLRRDFYVTAADMAKTQTDFAPH